MQTKDSLKTYQIMEKGEAEAGLGPGGGSGAGKLKDLHPLFSGLQQPEQFLSQERQPGVDHGLLDRGNMAGLRADRGGCFPGSRNHTGGIVLKAHPGAGGRGQPRHGILYTPSCVAAYRLTGNETAREAALLAADNLMGRFQEKGQFFQAWGQLGARDNYRLIIDCPSQHAGCCSGPARPPETNGTGKRPRPTSGRP